MPKINTTYIKKCNQALQKAHQELQKCKEEDFIYEMYRSATIKEFEIVLEQSGKLLKKFYSHIFIPIKRLINCISKIFLDKLEIIAY